MDAPTETKICKAARSSKISLGLRHLHLEGIQATLQDFSPFPVQVSVHIQNFKCLVPSARYRMGCRDFEITVSPRSFLS
jgi:hypothetical protein